MKRWIVTILAIAAGTGVARADTSYTVRWTAVEHMLTPTRATLANSWIDRFSVDGTSVTTYANGTQATTAPRQAALFTMRIGTPYRVAYDFRDGSIRQTFSFSGFIERVSVTPGGETGCRAKISYAKIPGHAVFSGRLIDDSGSSTSSQVEAANVTCQATGG